MCCLPTEHAFEVARSGYYKTTGATNVYGHIYEQEVEYAMLFCTKCGTTKEIVSTDHRKNEEDND